jgi:hypothetical protein
MIKLKDNYQLKGNIYNMYLKQGINIFHIRDQAGNLNKVR